MSRRDRLRRRDEAEYEADARTHSRVREHPVRQPARQEGYQRAVRHRIGLEVVAAVPPLLADFKAPFGTDPDHRNHPVGIAVRLDPGGPVVPIALPAPVSPEA
jgi:hypothetical protein